MFAVYRIKELSRQECGWDDHRFNVRVNIVTDKGAVEIKVGRPTRQEALQAVSDAGSLYGVTRFINMGEKGFDRPEAGEPPFDTPTSARQSALYVSLMDVARRTQRDIGR